jgi:hypothetical protein
LVNSGLIGQIKRLLKNGHAQERICICR